jgi:hypothetical protein
LTRRANHRHIVSLAAIDRSNRARAGKPAAGFLCRSICTKILELSAMSNGEVRGIS